MIAVYRFLLSLKTVFWLFTVALLFLLAGSLMIPENLAFYSGIDDAPLFSWLRNNWNPALTWWIYGIVGALGVLAASTMACTADFLLKKMSRRHFVLKISPQIMHVGVLFIMLGHLLTASGGFKKDHTVGTGDVFSPDTQVSLKLDNVRIVNDEDGFPADWFGTLTWFRDGTEKRQFTISPAHPFFFQGYGVWFSSVSVEDDGSITAVFRVTKDPGVRWALFGAVLLCLGGLAFLVARVRASTRTLEQLESGCEK